jgi:TonB family protein
MLRSCRSEALVSARSHRLLIAGIALTLTFGLGACGEDEEKPAAGQENAAAEGKAQGAGGSAPATSSGDPSDTSGLVAAARAYAEEGCATARRELEYCAACETTEQKPLRDLLLAYCREREAPGEARALYEAIITSHPDTEAAVTAIMRVRQIDAAELPPLGDYAGPKPTPLERPGPAYPTLAESAGIEGKVRVRFDVREDGGVTNVRVVDSTPPLLFDSVALYAVSSWEYQPGQAAESQQITLRFDLTDEEVAAGKRATGEPSATGEAAK